MPARAYSGRPLLSVERGRVGEVEGVDEQALIEHAVVPAARRRRLDHRDWRCEPSASTRRSNCYDEPTLFSTARACACARPRRAMRTLLVPRLRCSEALNGGHRDTLGGRCGHAAAGRARRRHRQLLELLARARSLFESRSTSACPPGSRLRALRRSAADARRGAWRSRRPLARARRPAPCAAAASVQQPAPRIGPAGGLAQRHDSTGVARASTARCPTGAPRSCAAPRAARRARACTRRCACPRPRPCPARRRRAPETLRAR